jgi:hypothetical protein
MEDEIRKNYVKQLHPFDEVQSNTGIIAGNIGEAVKEGVTEYGQYLKEKPMAETIPTSLNELGKGLLSGLGGIIGDTESLVRGIIEIAKTPEGASKIESFIKGLEQETFAPTSESFETKIETVTGQTPKGAGTPEVVGNIAAPVGALVEGLKLGAKAIKSTKILSKESFGNSKTVKLFRGVPEGKDALDTKNTVGNALFKTPDENVAKIYAGKKGTVTSEEITFNNLLEADNWFKAKEKLGLPKNSSMQNLIKEAEKQGFDGISFKTTNGLEYVQISNSSNKAIKSTKKVK